MSEPSHTPIGVGIAGLGRSGWNIHAASLEALPSQYSVRAVADIVPERCEQAVAKFGCKSYETFETLCDDGEVELVVVATPSLLHPSQAIHALTRGKHVVCEKPMAASVAEADEMISGATRGPGLLAMFQNRRFAPDFLKVREIVQSGKLGRIVQIRIAMHMFRRRWDWQTLKDFGGGELQNAGSHLIDWALQLFGEGEPRVFCNLDRVLASGDAEDHVKIILTGANAPTIDIEITNACAYPQPRWHVMGASGGLSGDFQTISWKYVDFSRLPERPVMCGPVPDRTYNWEELPWTEESWSAPKNPPPSGVPFYKELFATLRHGTPLTITPEQVRRVITVLERCREICPL